MELEKPHFWQDNQSISLPKHGLPLLVSTSELKPIKSVTSMPKFNFGIQLDNKDSDPSKDLITKVKTFLILGAHAILLCFDLSDKNSFKDLAQ